MDETNTLCEAVVAWVSAVLPRIGPDQFQIIEAMLAGRCDVAVEARLLKGTVTLVAIGEAHGPMVLYRDAVAPLRPGFVTPPERTGASDGAMCKSMSWLGRAERTQVDRVQLRSTERPALRANHTAATTTTTASAAMTTTIGKRFADPLVRSMTGACKAGLGSTRWRYDCRRQNGRPIGRLEGEPRQSA